MANKLVKIGEEIKDAFTRDLVNALAKLGGEAVLYAYRKKSFTNRTFNLHDSYGSAVYVNGVLQERTIRYAGGQMSHRPGILKQTGNTPKKRRSKLGKRYYRYGKNGRDVLHVFFRGNEYYKGHKFGKSGIVLVVVAAMWYAGMLAKKGYRIIGAANDYLDSHLDNVIIDVCKQYGVPKKYVRAVAINRADEDYFGDDFKYTYEA
jgi:hypothetical protein